MDAKETKTILGDLIARRGVVCKLVLDVDETSLKTFESILLDLPEDRQKGRKVLGIDPPSVCLTARVKRGSRATHAGDGYSG